MGIGVLTLILCCMLATTSGNGFVHNAYQDACMLLPVNNKVGYYALTSNKQRTNAADLVTSAVLVDDTIALWEDLYFRDIFDTLERLNMCLHGAAERDNIHGVLRQLGIIQRTGVTLNGMYKNFCRRVIARQQSATCFDYLLRLLRRNYHVLYNMSIEINSFFDSPALKFFYHQEKMDWAEPFVTFDVVVFDSLYKLYRQMPHLCDDVDFIIASQQHEEVVSARNKSPAHEFTFDGVNLV